MTDTANPDGLTMPPENTLADAIEDDEHRREVAAARDAARLWNIGPEVEAPVWGPEVEAPPLRYLLRADHSKGAAGILELGAAGYLIGEGAVGKGWAALDLAVAVAAGRAPGDREGPRWMGAHGPVVAHPGHVLFLTAEDRLRHVQIRLRKLLLARLADSNSATQRALRRLHVVCTQDRPKLRGMRLQDDHGVMTGEGRALLASLRAAADDRLQRQGGDPMNTDGSVPWRLVVIDTLSRTAALEAETDAHVASRYTGILEDLAACNPEGFDDAAVIALHHTGKGKGRGEGARAARGSSALTDNARWVGHMTRKAGPDGDKDLRPWRVFDVAKVNHGPDVPPLAIKQTPDGELGGVLEVRPMSEMPKGETTTKRRSGSSGKPSSGTGPGVR